MLNVLYFLLIKHITRFSLGQKKSFFADKLDQQMKLKIMIWPIKINLRFKSF
jgi:hypothetical protein